MTKKQQSDLVPQQHTGKLIDTESSVELPGEDDAKSFFEEVCNRLSDVTHWHAYAGAMSASFTLVDEHGTATERKVAKNDYLKIDIPGPGSKSGDGYDWVH